MTSSAATPTRHRDRAVAEALGYAVNIGEWEYDGLVSTYEVWITDPARKDEPPRQRQDVTINPIPFSTDIAAAMTLVGEAAKRGYDYFRLKADHGIVETTPNEVWLAAFTDEFLVTDEMFDIDWSAGTTPAAAIAEAFLACVTRPGGRTG